jgi:hypothetical protein
MIPKTAQSNATHRERYLNLSGLGARVLNIRLTAAAPNATAANKTNTNQ